MKQSAFFILFIMAATFFYACGNDSKLDKDEMKETADSFATAFYNFQYGKALALCDSSAKKQVYFIVAGLNRKDVEVIRQSTERATVEITDAHFNAGDSTGTVDLTVKNFFRKDSIGVTGQIIKKASYVLPLRKEGGRWFVQFNNMKPSEK